MNALCITHSETAPKGPSIEAQCAAPGYLEQRPTIFQALKGRNILSEAAPKGPSIEAQCAALGYLGQPPTTFQALKGRNILKRSLMTGA